jgi:predicted transcriptional regulator
LTSYGRAVRNVLPSFAFLSLNRAYFMSHDLSRLPAEFVKRAGDLLPHEYGDTVGAVMDVSEGIVTQAEEYLWLMADHPVRKTSFITAALAGKPTRVRILGRETASAREDFKQAKRTLGDKFEARLMATPEVALAMNEREAGLAFPDLTGKVDYNRGFQSSDAEFRKWCGDLFLFYWDKAKIVV